MIDSKLSSLLIAIYAVFIGSQITEGVLLVPYWQSLSTSDFYTYYAMFGPSIGKFYTILTIVACLIPLNTTVIFFSKKSKAKSFALLSAIFSVLVIACFYIYFKGTNEAFYQKAFSAEDLTAELITWSTWHWSRIGLEIASLIFLVLAFDKTKK